MTAEEYINLLKEAEDCKNWTPELFQQYQQACIMMEPCIFNELRKILPEKKYKAFDLAYCEYIRPGQKEVVRHIEELHRKESAKQWEQKRTKRRNYKNSPRSNFLTISKALGFQLENKECARQ